MTAECIPPFFLIDKQRESTMSKTTMRKALVILAGLAMMLGPSIAQATLATIAIDGDMSDWAGVPLAASDPLDASLAVDFADLYLANDDDFLYVRFTLHASGNPFTFQTNSFYDADASSSTGFVPTGTTFGSEMLIQGGSGFQEKNGGFNEGGINGLLHVNASSGALPATDFEFRVSRNATYASDGLSVFAQDDIAFLLQNDLGDKLTTTGVSYTFATSAVPEPSLFLFGVVLIVGRWSLGRPRH